MSLLKQRATIWITSRGGRNCPPYRKWQEKTDEQFQYYMVFQEKAPELDGAYAFDGAVAGKGRDRLTIAHEIGHLFLHEDDAIALCRLEPGRS